ncbi:MAG TPA: alanyl-tRNA editing protein [Candidatus Krumholzibacteriaceae bacterium]|jgi:alanyl-tRNA synthetase|nr:alanyl-tRNA editing protein [Candidatus Krumholzibacteriaceae bacterium]
MPEEKTATRLLYYENAYIRHFAAKVIQMIQVDGQQGLVLDQTSFYPMGGGQPADKGVLKDKSGNWEAQVTDVQWRDGVPVHVLANVKGEIKEQNNVLGEIDWNHRWALMRNHTAAHLISPAIRQAVGKPLEIVGSAINVDKSRLDLGHEGSLRDLFSKIEEIANRVVAEDRQVMIKIMPRVEAERYVENFHESLKTLPPSVESVRIVEIKDWHACACGGTHVKSARELGSIKVLGRAAKGKGVERIEFVAQNP